MIMEFLKLHGKKLWTKNAVEYASKASDFFLRSQIERLPTKIGPDGTIRIYDFKTIHLEVTDQMARLKYFIN